MTKRRREKKCRQENLVDPFVIVRPIILGEIVESHEAAQRNAAKLRQAATDDLFGKKTSSPK